MEIARHWRLKAQRYRFQGSICPVCGQVNFPPRPACRQCGHVPGRRAGLEAVLPTAFRMAEAEARHDREFVERMTG